MPVPSGLVKACRVREALSSPPAAKLSRSISRPERNIKNAKPSGARMPRMGWSSGTSPRPLRPTIMPATNSPTTMGIKRPLSRESRIGTRKAKDITTISGMKLVSMWATGLSSQTVLRLTVAYGRSSCDSAQSRDSTASDRGGWTLAFSPALRNPFPTGRTEPAPG